MTHLHYCSQLDPMARITLPIPLARDMVHHPSRPSTLGRFSIEPKLFSTTEAAQFCFMSPPCFYILGGIYPFAP